MNKLQLVRKLEDLERRILELERMISSPAGMEAPSSPAPAVGLVEQPAPAPGEAPSVEGT